MEVVYQFGRAWLMFDLVIGGVAWHISYIMMAEPDHVFIKPLPNLATEDMPAAFAFFYITPKENEEVLRKFYPKELGPITNIDPIGNSPVIIKKVLPPFLIV